jgi:hypothetical protein
MNQRSPALVVVDRDGKSFLRPVLTDDVLVEDVVELFGLGSSEA